MDPEIGQYYRSLQDHTDDHDDKGVPKGDLARVRSIDDEHVSLRYFDEYLYYSHDDFHRLFEVAPTGAQERASEVAQLIDEIHQAETHDLTDIRQQMTSFSPHVGDDGEVCDETGLVKFERNNPQTIAERIGEVEKQLKNSTMHLERKQTRLQKLLEEQSRALESKMSELQDLAKVAKEAIYTISLYLGEEEEIKQLKKGKPAHRDEKIVIRQQVLFMDEESVVAAYDGGIDHENVEWFDEWLLEGDNIDRLLPEVKGIVACQPRRVAKRRNTGNIFTDAAMAKADESTYFLIRNGDNVFRIWSKIEVDKNLLPLRHEFDHLFMQDGEYDWDKHSRGPKKHIKPGSPAYMDAMEKANAKNRHYMRILLFIQGLLDRTDVFHPLPGPRVNVMDHETNADHMRYIYDMEMALPSGKLSFKDWQEDINSKLAKGQRVIGIFNSYTAEQYCEVSKRRPSYAWGGPADDGIYPIEKAVDDGLVFYYEDDNQYREKRCSFTVYPTDRIILNFDEATVDDMRFYIESRQDRSDYMFMIPVLQRAIAMKLKETDEEKPFRALLIGEIMKEYKVDREQVESEVDDLIRWWKFKNRMHRALLSDDGKALRMIVKAYASAVKRTEMRKKLTHYRDEFLSAIRKAHRNVLYVGHVDDNEVIVYEPSNDANVFVTAHTWVIDRRNWTFRKRDTEEWQVVPKAVARWEEWDRSERFDNWSINPIRRQFLSDPEREAFIEQQWKAVEDSNIANWDRWDEKKRDRVWGRRVNDYGVCAPICVNYCEDRNEYSFYVWHEPFRIPKRGLYDARSLGLRNLRVFKWMPKIERDGSLSAQDANGWHTTGEVTGSMSKPVWENNNYHNDRHEYKTLWRDKKTIAAMVKTEAEVDRVRDRIKEISDKHYAALRSVDKQHQQHLIEALRVKFDEEVGEDDLWDTWLKRQPSIDKRVAWNDIFSDASGILIENGVDIDGMSVEEVLRLGIPSLRKMVEAKKADEDALKTDEALDSEAFFAEGKEKDDDAWASSLGGRSGLETQLPTDIIVHISDESEDDDETIEEGDSETLALPSK